MKTHVLFNSLKIIILIFVFATTASAKMTEQEFNKPVSNSKALNSSVSPQYFFEMVDFNGDAFAYAPAIIREDSLFKVIFCSSGISRTAWDFLRYTDSASWKNRKRISVVLQPTSKKVGDHRNRSTCDPSLVKADDGWYSFISLEVLILDKLLFTLHGPGILIIESPISFMWVVP